MIGDIAAWILGALSLAVLIGAERRRRQRREEYHRELIREFSGEDAERE